LVTALPEIGFAIDDGQAGQIRSGKDFVPLKNGPFDLDLVSAPDGAARSGATTETCGAGPRRPSRSCYL